MRTARRSSSGLPLTEHWPGCLGVRLSGDAEAYGRARGTPLLDASVRRGEVTRAEGRRIWRLAGEVQLADGPRTYDQELVRTSDGALELRAEHATLRADVAERALFVDAPNEGVALQLVTTYGLPLLLEDAPALVLHACAAVPPGGDSALVVCASSGTGKSTLLLTLLAAGWRAVSEDVSTLDLRDTEPQVWPGPPWLRRAGAGPPGARSLYELPDKTAWDVASMVVDGPVPVGRVVFMEPAGGAKVICTNLDDGPTIGALAVSTIWLSNPSRRAETTFAASVRVASRVPGTRLRMPVSDDWSAQAEARLRQEMERA